MQVDIGKLLPRPGPLWGIYPCRPLADFTPPWRGLKPGRLRSPLAEARRLAAAAAQEASVWQALAGEQRASLRQALRRDLRREGLTAPLLARALGMAANCASETLGMTPRPGQLLAAAVLLDLRFAEMATGEGKTLALALAAAVGGLAGMPVHLATANTYLAARDAAWLAPFYQALGLTVAALPAAGDDEARRAAYQSDVVYSTARDLAFDFLRDSLIFKKQPETASTAAVPSAKPIMRGLCMALIDEADSILLDEADVPLILSRGVPHTARRAFLWQALAMARQLERDRDFSIGPAERNATLTASGEARMALLADPLGGAWTRARYRREAITLALTGLHACRRDEHYVVRDGAIELLDEITGRIAHGRVWSRGLHTVVALKEGLSPPAETDTVAQITFQRFFQRYWRVAGLSGTLLDARSELRDVLGAAVVRIPLHVPGRCQTLPPRLFENAEARWPAVCERVAALSGIGRPVLIGTDSVADSRAVSEHLLAAGIAHQVLNALNDAHEAAIIAGAGCSGRVTVATRMAGRGTDIELDAAARAAGGLHVLSCQNNPSRRLDRQLAGRAGRQGDPGSVEFWWLASSYTGKKTSHRWDTWAKCWGMERLVWLERRWLQRREENRRAAMRAELLRQDIYWARRLAFAGPSR